jgi:hypothetical protein
LLYSHGVAAHPQWWDHWAMCTGGSVKELVNEFQDSVLWAALEGILTELKATGEVAINTSPGYVISYLCQELSAKRLVTAEALGPRRGTEGRGSGPTP